jgi:Major intrinsic protein
VPDLASPVPARPNLGRRLLAEFVGTGLLVCVVIGSGIAAERLSPDDVGLQLLQNSITTVFGLGVLILLFGPVSDAHFNPVVSAVDWLLGRRSRSGLTGADTAAYAGRWCRNPHHQPPGARLIPATRPHLRGLSHPHVHSGSGRADYLPQTPYPPQLSAQLAMRWPSRTG